METRNRHFVCLNCFYASWYPSDPQIHEGATGHVVVEEDPR